MSQLKPEKTAITPIRQKDYPQWYQAVIKAADLAENSIVRGCMVIKPWGYAIWEHIQKDLDFNIKKTGHQNFYFPIFVPLSFLAKEAEHVEGFAKECAVVTHHRLETDPITGELVPAGKLEEPLVIRPTSEAIIGEAFSRWIQSYRDLPLLGNQWANVVRWEMRPRIFLRTSEFLWQEGHTAHATKSEAVTEAQTMLKVYQELCENLLAIPVMIGEKTAREKFPGADITYTLEMMMQDQKALQAGTSHFLGQNFSKAFNIKFMSESGTEEYTWTTSWGVTTRLIGALIMVHSDDNGLVLPPKIAPTQIIIIPLLRNNLADQTQNQFILDYCQKINQSLESQAIRSAIDQQDKRTGDKVWHWIKKGVPIRLEIGQQELEKQTICLSRRDQAPRDKIQLDYHLFLDTASELLNNIQSELFERAKNFRTEHTITVQSKEDFYSIFQAKDLKTGFVLAYWAGDENTENDLKKKFSVTPRCIPLETRHQKKPCIFTGAPNGQLTLFARAY